MTADSALWGTLAAIPGAEQIKQFDTIAELLGAWPRNRPAVVALDARSVGDLATALDALGAHSPAIVAIAMVDEERRVSAATLERQRRLFEHLLLPIDPGTAKSVFEHAAEESLARRALEVGDPPPEPVATDQAPPASAPAVAAPKAVIEPPRRHGRKSTVPAAPPAPPSRTPTQRRTWWIVAAIASLLCAGAAWYALHDAAPLPTAATPAPAGIVSPAAPATPAAAPTRASTYEQVDQLLERARLAMRDRRYIDPAEDNALAHYKAVLALDPKNGEARQGLERTAELLLARAAVSLGARDNGAALRSLEAARAIAPDHPRLAALDAQVGAHAAELSAGQVQAAMQAGAFARATMLLGQGEKAGVISAADAASLRQELARRSAAAQIAELARLAQTRISQGQLMEPVGDNAKGYLAALAERGGTAMSDEVARLTELYQKRVATEARSAIAAGAWTQAETWIGELRSSRGGAVLAQPLQKEVDRHAADSRPVEPARPAPSIAEAPAAPSQGPGAAAPPAPMPAIASPAHLAKALKVDYPRAAAIANASGWVTIEADVDGTGHALGVRVVAAEPAGMFDNAAREAVRHATFVPATATDGSHPRTSVSMRILFKLEDRK